MVVAVTGGGSSQRQMADQLRRKLAGRGFRVQFLEGHPHRISPEADITILSCSEGDVSGLADQIEREWMERWQSWFAARKARVGKKSKSR
ncbi:MAG: hypothetical protein NC819_00285 [Candidatus Omnitrophica bacterium]|nr:hypothetical protein [Candidatus Omnitrophota bacterium]